MSSFHLRVTTPLFSVLIGSLAILTVLDQEPKFEFRNQVGSMEEIERLTAKAPYGRPPEAVSRVLGFPPYERKLDKNRNGICRWQLLLMHPNPLDVGPHDVVIFRGTFKNGRLVGTSKFLKGLE